MKLANYINDEKHGSVLIYNFSKAYGDVPMDVFSLILPLLNNDDFRKTLIETNNVDSALYQCKKNDLNFIDTLADSIKELEDLTSSSLGICLINKYITFELKSEILFGFVQSADIDEISIAQIMGAYFKGKSLKEILSMINEVSICKIVVLDYDAIGHDIALNELEKYGHVTVYNNVLNEQIENVITNANVIVTNKKILGQEQLQKATKLELICLTATGFNTIDIKYCKENNIKVANVSSYSTDSVAQHTFALLLSLQNKISYYNNFITSTKYSQSGLFSHFDEPIHELSGKTWGIIGMGNIGQSVAKIATAFGCQVQYYSTSGKNNDQPYQSVDFNKLLSSSDIISIHAPLNEKTNGLIDAMALAKMKKDAFLINVGRGQIIVENDLIFALENKIIAGAGLDVFNQEPIDISSKLLVTDHSNLIMTPHIAWAAVESRTRCIKEVSLNIKAYIEGKERNIVN